MSISRIHRGLAFLVLGLGVLQFFLAGVGVWGDGLGSPDYDAHRMVGGFMVLGAPILVLLAVIGRREALAASVAFLVLMLVQNGLAAIGTEADLLAALHPLNGLFVLGAAHQAARGLPLPFGGRSAHHTTS